MENHLTDTEKSWEKICKVCGHPVSRGGGGGGGSYSCKMWILLKEILLKISLIWNKFNTGTQVK